MRKILNPVLSAGRVRGGEYGTDDSYELNGAFMLDGPCARRLAIIANDAESEEAEGWEHVSVSTATRVPNWQEMCFVKDLFWEDEECVVQFHPPKSRYVNFHSFTLHMWRNTKIEVSLPPMHFVGPVETV